MKKPPYEGLESYRAVVVIIYLIVAIWYFTWRLGTFNPEAQTFSWIIYCAELFGLLTCVLHFFMSWRLSVRIPPLPPENVSVDIFIPTINESVDLLRRTILAAQNVQYAHETWLLDDGNRPAMAKLAEELGCHYLARNSNEGAKAGNLNHALEHSRAEFIAIFDADHAPQRNFLTDTLGYFQDKRVAFVQTPQDFFNLDSYQHRPSSKHNAVWTEQALFFRIIQRGKDCWNAAFFCGSCAVIRREALDRIGGFASETVTEDLHTSLRLHKQGFRSVYHAESLAFGLAPTNVVPFIKQRIRWGRGAMQVWRREGIFFTRGLTLAQRINYFASLLTYFEGWQKLILYFAPVIVLLTGVMPIKTLNGPFLLHFIPYYLLSFWSFEEIGRGFGQTVYAEQYNMSRFAGFAWATLAFIKNRDIKFDVTPKVVSRRKEMFRYSAPQFIVATFNFVAVPVGITLYLLFHRLPADALIANVVWASVNYIMAAMVLSFNYLRSKSRRKEYRFQLPLSAKLKIKKAQNCFLTVDDISSSGCRLHGVLPSDLELGNQIDGALILPVGSLDFKGKVTSIAIGKPESGRRIHTLGCQFIWADHRQRNLLELFLFGSDLEWQMRNLTDHIRTPLQWIIDVILDRPRDEYNSHSWSTITFQKTRNRQSSNIYLGLISDDTPIFTDQTIITSKQLDIGSCIWLTKPDHPERGVIGVKIMGGFKLTSPISSLYRYQIEILGVTQSAKDNNRLIDPMLDSALM